jgi:hypothetical protein
MTEGTTVTVKVTQNAEGRSVDDYVIDDGAIPNIIVQDGGELWITKSDPAQTQVDLVGVYARGAWIRAWIEEPDHG